VDTTDKAAISALRSVAHPVRLRILSMLTAQPMSAAEVARELDLTHANASYHLRQLHDIGELVVESEEKIRGGVAKRYRYDATREVADRSHAIDDRIAYAAANALGVVRRLRHAAEGPGPSGEPREELLEEGAVVVVDEVAVEVIRRGDDEEVALERGGAERREELGVGLGAHPRAERRVDAGPDFAGALRRRRWR